MSFFQKSKRRSIWSAARRIAAALCLTAVGAGAAQAQDSCRLHSNNGGNGFVVGLSDGQDVRRLGVFMDRRASSITLRNGCSVTLFSGRNFEGASITIDESIFRLPSEWLNRARSAMCECGRFNNNDDRRRDDDERMAGRDNAPDPRRGGPACIVFRDNNFNGPWRAFERGTDEARLGRRLNGEVSSIQVANGCFAVIDINRPYRLIINDDTSRLPNAANDRATNVSCRCPR